MIQSVLVHDPKVPILLIGQEWITGKGNVCLYYRLNLKIKSLGINCFLKVREREWTWDAEAYLLN